ncbi:AraC-like DNA-binding protein [Chitinophaga skermanii]|uniref:AraC-like DNA-binding protein n=1 Tax=Chitinophaga skermanii TaxID=331697 RepID=A0A327QTB7_9BACT|nr:AraC family transcriptional regulator [Chitinophaga skermanii]RAJ06894.1 AraC-like DNA-binding protein [Chitinophaga skermanii]
MKTLSGDDFKYLLARQVNALQTPMPLNVPANLDHLIKAKTVHHRGPGFDMIHFRGSFDEETRVVDFYDETHTSLHFQLAGSSWATIGPTIDNADMQPMQYNLYNCHSPISQYRFPKQNDYHYFTISLSPAKTIEKLQTLQHQQADAIIDKILQAQTFSFIGENRRLTPAMLQSIQAIDDCPFEGAIREVYLDVKLTEFLIHGLFDTQNALTSKQQHGIQDVCAYLQEMCPNIYDAPTLSQQFRLPAQVIVKGLKAATGMSLFAYQQHLRMQWANVLLQSGERNVNEVADILGYSQASHFIHAYKKLFGYTPKKMQ